MSSFFSRQNPSGPFLLFSPPHIMAILFIFLANLLLYYFRNSLKDKRLEKYFRYGLCAILIIQEASFHLWSMETGQWSVNNSLPLQLCSISALLSCVMLISKSKWLYEILYFWGIGGALQAILTPEIGPYTFPHFRYFQFFLGHGALIAAPLFMTFVAGYRANIKSLFRSFAALNIYAAFIGAINYALGANYLFLCQKPQVSSVMDFLGPWPWYILSLEFVALFIFFILWWLGTLIPDYPQRVVRVTGSHRGVGPYN